MYEKIAGIKYERQRRFIRWTADGQLEPGQRMVIDYMLPVATDENTMVESELLSSKGYGFKSGAFEPSIPVSQNVKNYAYEIDTRDVNDNGKSNIENTITVSVNNVGFAGTQAFNRNKRAFSEYGYGMSEKGTGADLIQSADHPQKRGFSAPGRPHKDKELPVPDLQRKILHRLLSPRINLIHVF